MRAALVFALRRTSARLVLAVGAGGLVWTVFRALRHEAPTLVASLGGTPGYFVPPVSSPLELAVAAGVGAVALVAAVALYRERSISR